MECIFHRPGLLQAVIDTVGSMISTDDIGMFPEIVCVHFYLMCVYWLEPVINPIDAIEWIEDFINIFEAAFNKHMGGETCSSCLSDTIKLETEERNPGLSLASQMVFLADVVISFCTYFRKQNVVYIR